MVTMSSNNLDQPSQPSELEFKVQDKKEKNKISYVKS